MPAPTIDCGSPPDGVIAVPYTHTLPNTHTGSVFTVTITGGALPPGLGMDGTGLITGTPTTLGTFPFTATITQPDSGVPVFTTITDYIGTSFINGDDGVIRAYGNSPTGVNRLSPIRWQLTVLNGPVTWTLIGGPITPVSSNTNSYTFDFSPGAQGDYSFTLQATNSVGSTTKTFTMGVGLYPPSGSNAVGAIGPFDQFVFLKDSGEHVIGPAFIGNSLAADGWTNPYAPGVILQLYGSGGTPNFAINVNTGPSDLGYGIAAVGGGSIPVIGENTAAIPLGTAHFTISFTILPFRPPGGGTVSASVDCTITIVGTTIDCGDPPGGVAGIPYSHAMPNTHSGAFTVAVTAGALPDGLTMDPSGVITGTPTVAGIFPYTATITDALGTDSVNCSITILAPSSLGLGCAAPPDGVVGVDYFHTFPVSGGLPPYTFSIISGILPPGLTLDSLTGEVSGRPTLAGDFEFQIQVSDDFGSTVGTCDILITVTELPGAGIDCGSSTDGTVGVSYSHTFPVTDIPVGATVSYSITGGALPPGLTLNTATGEVTGTPTTEGNYTFTITLTVSEPESDVLTDFAGAIIYTTAGDTIIVTHGIGGL